MEKSLFGMGSWVMSMLAMNLLEKITKILKNLG